MITEEKRSLRKLVKILKNDLSEADRQLKSANIFKELANTEEFRNSDTVLLYWSMDDEVFTLGFIERWWKEKVILLPVVKGDTLDIKIYLGKNSMTPGERYGILEPTGTTFTNYEAIDLFVVPGVAFSKNNFRMGRGKGYYDKLLTKHRASKIGVCYDFQIFETVPIESHDVAMDKVISG